MFYGRILDFMEATASNKQDKIIDSLIIDRQAFNDFVYMSLEEALVEYKKRQTNSQLAVKVRELLPQGVPEPLMTGNNAVLFRQLATSNYEFRRFLSVSDALEGFKGVIWEYFDDKFTSNNDWKKSLGKIPFYHGSGKKGGSKIDRLNVIDFNTWNGKKIKDVKTLWGQSLVGFHQELIQKTCLHLKHAVFYDASTWFSESGGVAKEYYFNFLCLFLRNGILFENFMIDMKEVGFTKEIFLPAFLKIIEETGLKPLIVALEPTDIEGDEFWMCHTGQSMDYVKEKIGLL